MALGIAKGIRGPQRFVEDVWRIITEPAKDDLAQAQPKANQVRELRRKTHQTIQALYRKPGDLFFQYLYRCPDGLSQCF